MTKEREESPEEVSSREAMEMVTDILEKMQTKYTASIDSMSANLDTFKQGVDTVDAKVQAINEQLEAGGKLEEGVPPSAPTIHTVGWRAPAPIDHSRVCCSLS